MENKFTIDNLSEKQIRLISKSLEFYTRFLFGQVENIPDDIRFKDNLISEKHEELEKHLKGIKNILFPELDNNSSYGVGNYNEVKGKDSFKLNGQIGYELYKDINKFLYDKYNDKSYWNVDSQEPLRYSKEGKIDIKSLQKPENIKKTRNINDIPF